MKNEIWKDITGYEKVYQISNLGRVKSLYRKVIRSNGCPFTVNEYIMKPYDDGNGYLRVTLMNKNIKQYKKIHQLVAIAFLNHTPCGHKLVVNHKNFIKTDNRVENLEIVTQRENANFKHINSVSQYVGVSFHNKTKTWRSRIHLNGKEKSLGYYKTEIEAHNAYQLKLKQINSK